MKREDLEAREFGLIIASRNFPFYAAPEADAVMDAMEARIKELEEVISKMETTTPKWISVKDRLPEGYREFDRFLVCCELNVDGKKRRYSNRVPALSWAFI